MQLNNSPDDENSLALLCLDQFEVEEIGEAIQKPKALSKNEVHARIADKIKPSFEFCYISEGRLYIFDKAKGHYRETSQNEMTFYILKILKNYDEFRIYADMLTAQKIFHHIRVDLKALPQEMIAKGRLILGEEEQNFAKKNKVIDFVVMKSQVILITEKGKLIFRKKTPVYFTFWSCNFDYQKDANCPQFKKMLKEIQPKTDVQQMLQEAIGSIFTQSINYERFYFFYGSGGNGKSALIAGIKATLGERNVSCVGINSFGAHNSGRFDLSTMRGKIANFSEDDNHARSLNEGSLRAVVSRQPILGDEKYAKAIPFIFRGIIFFSTNILPSFKYLGDAMSRRARVIQFKEKFLDEKERNPNLNKVSFWENSGELPGIFNWMLDGALRPLVRAVSESNQPYLFESFEAKHMSSRFLSDQNTAIQWLQENYFYCEACPEETLYREAYESLDKELRIKNNSRCDEYNNVAGRCGPYLKSIDYNDYKRAMETSREKVESDKKFAEAVLIAFPVYKTEEELYNPRRNVKVDGRNRKAKIYRNIISNRFEQSERDLVDERMKQIEEQKEEKIRNRDERKLTRVRKEGCSDIKKKIEENSLDINCSKNELNELHDYIAYQTYHLGELERLDILKSYKFKFNSFVHYDNEDIERLINLMEAKLREKTYAYSLDEDKSLHKGYTFKKTEDLLIEKQSNDEKTNREKRRCLL